MYRLSLSALVCFALAWPVTAREPTPFFDGKTLDGWEGLIDEFWSVKDGAIVGHTAKPLPFNTFLCSKRPYGNFELSFRVEILDEKGQSAVRSRNSGVQVRSEIFDRKHFAVKGPQCDIGQGYWGSLYGEHTVGMMKAADPGVIEKVLKTDGPNDYHIRCVGKRVTIKLNGQTTVDGEFPIIPERGVIAFQMHSGGPMTVRFRDVRFTELGKTR